VPIRFSSTKDLGLEKQAVCHLAVPQTTDNKQSNIMAANTLFGIAVRFRSSLFGSAQCGLHLVLSLSNAPLLSLPCFSLKNHKPEPSFTIKVNY
jgi:hypothetical protein